MSHFAHITNIEFFVLTLSGTELSGYRGVVDNVIRAEQDFINKGSIGEPSYWIQTSYNDNIRNTYAGIGFYYDTIRDIFYPQPPYPSWVLIEYAPGKWKWEAPVPYPLSGGNYYWDETSVSWVLVSSVSAN